MMFQFARWFLAQQNNCLRIVERQCLLCQLPHWRASMTSVQKRKWRNWSPSSHSVESQQGLPTESHCSILRAPFRHFERLMTHPRGNYVNVLYLKASMLQRRKSLTKFGRRPFTKQTYPSMW